LHAKPAGLRCAVVASQGRLISDRHEDVERATHVSAKKRAWRHTDDRDGNAVQGGASADHRGVAVKATPPERVADDHHGTSDTPARTIVCLGQDPARPRTDAEHLEI